MPLTKYDVFLNKLVESNETLSTVGAPVSGTYTQLLTDVIITANTASGDIIINMVDAALFIGKSVSVQKTAAANDVIMTPISGQTINDDATFSFYNRFEAYSFQSDGSNWIYL